jgi:hypothetical protein
MKVMEGERQKNGPGDGPKNWPVPFPLRTKDTLYESPIAYKKAADILAVIHDTIEVKKRLMPVYNFKAAG